MLPPCAICHVHEQSPSLTIIEDMETDQSAPPAPSAPPALHTLHTINGVCTYCTRSSDQFYYLNCTCVRKLWLCPVITLGLTWSLSCSAIGVSRNTGHLAKLSTVAKNLNAPKPSALSIKLRMLLPQYVSSHLARSKRLVPMETLAMRCPRSSPRAVCLPAYLYPHGLT
jgi:hypothetical protein